MPPTREKAPNGFAVKMSLTTTAAFTHSHKGGKKNVLFKKILPTVFDLTRFSIFKSKVLPIILVSNACVFFKLPFSLFH